MSDELLPKDWEGKPVVRSLVEDLADVLARLAVGWTDMLGFDLSEHPDVQRVMARFRLEKDDVANWLRWGKEVEDDCHLWGNCLHQRIQSETHRVDPAEYQIKLQPPQKPLWPNKAFMGDGSMLRDGGTLDLGLPDDPDEPWKRPGGDL